MTTNSSPSRSLLRGIGILYILLIVTMAVATIVEHAIGSEATHSMIYGSWWFVGLWAMLVATGTTWLIRQLRRKPISFNTIITFIIHLSLVVILVGAFITHVGSQQGIIHLRGDQPTNLFDNMGSGDAGMTRQQLPFYLKLDRFNVRYHAGTDTPEDYETYFSIIDGHQTLHASVSMNRIFSYRHYRLYQASYDTDNQGSYLSVNYDPWYRHHLYRLWHALYEPHPAPRQSPRQLPPAAAPSTAAERNALGGCGADAPMGQSHGSRARQANG